MQLNRTNQLTQFLTLLCALMFAGATAFAAAPPKAGETGVALKQIGKWGGINRGSIGRLRVAGNLAYVSTDKGLTVLDVSDPAAPIVIGSVAAGYYARGLELVGNLVFTAGSDGLEIIDVSNPASPALVGSLALAYPNGSHVVGSLAYVADGDGLKLIDVRDPSHPSLLGQYLVSGGFSSVQVAGKYAHLSSWSGGLQIVDVSNPGNLTMVGSYPANGAGLKIVGTHAYVLNSFQVDVLDLTNPTNPIKVASFSAKSQPVDLFASGTLLFLSCYGTTPGLEIVDITLATSPTSAGFYPSSSALSAFEVGGTVYLSGNTAGLEIVDVRSPANPSQLGWYHSGEYANDVQIEGNLAYVADPWSGLQVLDVTDPSAITPVGSCSIENANRLRVSGGMAYLGTYSAVQVVDVSDPRSPRILGHCSTARTVAELQVAGNRVYCLSGPGGPLKQIDVTDPSNPVLSATIPGTAFGFHVTGDLLYLAGYDLRIEDISDPTNPIFVGRYDYGGSASGIHVRGNLAFLTGGGYPFSLKGLQILDVSNPTNPVRLGGYQDAGRTNVFALAGNYAYLRKIQGIFPTFLEVVDVSNVAQPVRAGGFPTSGTINRMQVVESRVYVANSNAGLLILEQEGVARPHLATDQHDGLPQLTVTGAAGTRWIPQRASTCDADATWTDLSAVTLGTTPAVISDTGATGEGPFFYRLQHAP